MNQQPQKRRFDLVVELSRKIRLDTGVGLWEIKALTNFTLDRDVAKRR